MATIFSEGDGTRKLTFTFSDNWRVYKYDEPVQENFHYKHSRQGLKAVDFIAASDKRLLLMEVKYVLAPNENSKLSFSPDADKVLIDRVRQALSDEDQKSVKLTSKRPYIVDEIAQKAKDTLLGLLASRRQSDIRLMSYSEALLVDQKPIILVLFLERDAELNRPESFKPMASTLQKAVEQKVCFLGNIQVLVVNTLTMPEGLGIKSLAET